MNERDTAFFNTFEEVLSRDVDPMVILNKLVKNRYLQPSHKLYYRNLLQQGQNSEILWKDLMTKIIKSCHISDFLKILYTSGCNKIAMQMIKLYRTKSKLPPPQGKSTSSRRGQKLYMDCKEFSHNNEHNPIGHCSKLCTENKVRFLTITDPMDRMEAADLYVSSLCVLISSYIMKYDRTINIDKFFSDLEQLASMTSNTHIFTISYHAHKALICAICERFEEGEDHINIAMETSFYVTWCVELVNLYYAKLFLLLAIYEKKPTKVLQEEILETAQQTLLLLEDEQDQNISEFWKRMILLRMAYCLLGLSYKGQPIAGLLPNNTHILKAKSILAEVYELRTGMVARRKISYEVAQARVAELESDFESAVYRLDLAVKGDTECNYGETESIKQYFESLQCKITETVVKETHTSSRKDDRLNVCQNDRRAQQQASQCGHRIARTEIATDGVAIKEYFEGCDVPVINLHGQITTPKIVETRS